MNPLQTLSQRLRWKLFLSYLLIALVAVIVLAGTANLQVGSALEHHMADMEAALRGGPSQSLDLEASFQAALNEIMAVALLAAVLAAVVVSSFTTGRILDPLQAMMRATSRIAGGDYHQRVQVISQDELGALGKSFNQMAEALEQTEQRRLELVGNVAHELRTPLTSIRGTMEGLIDGVLAPEPATFVEVQREVARLQRLVRDLEELSQAEAGQIVLGCQATAPEDLIEAAVTRLRPQFEDKGVSLGAELTASLPEVLVDPGRITQVLLNLLGNALHYTPPGGHVVISAVTRPRNLLIAVRDTGIGISAADLPHIFERFYRVDKSRSRAGGGSGIGLTIAKHLVEAHGGRIWAESPGPGQGSTLSFSLPLAVE